MANFARDINIGYPSAPETFREVLVDLKVGENLSTIKATVEANQEELERIRLAEELILGGEVKP